MKSTAGSSERRRHARAPFPLEVRLDCTGEEFTASVSDISEGGLRLEPETDRPLPSPLQVRIPLRGRGGVTEECALEGQVIRRTGPSVSIAFGRLLPRHMLQLRDYVWRSSRPDAL
jgi:hypothetical protein